MLPEQLLQVFDLAGAGLVSHLVHLPDLGQLLHGVCAGAGLLSHLVHLPDLGQLLQVCGLAFVVTHFLQQPQPFFIWPFCCVVLLGLLHAAKEKAINRIETNFIINLHTLQLT